MDATWIVVTAAVVLVAGWYLFFSATRLDRFHGRVEGARSALDAQLVRRASVSFQLAVSGLFDPAASLLLADAAQGARDAAEPDREVAESNLTRTIQAVLSDPSLAAALDADPAGHELLSELAAASKRVELARRFLNDAVRGARVVRRKRIVRYLRLAGHAPWPPTFEMDDTPPPGLVRTSAAGPSNVVR